jgi:predicted alpha/beta-fold hydrolase
MIGIDFPQFRPHPLLRGGHAQTIAGVYFPGKLSPYAAQRHFVELEDGDRIVLHDDTPADWQPGGRVVLLVHGLGGCHSSPYMVRIAAKLLARGARVFRIDLRGWGDGAETAKLPFHAARTADIAAALWFVDRLTHASPTALVGFSLGGNMVLKLLGDAGRSSRRSDSATNSSRNEASSAEYLPVALDRAMAIAPPIDLLFCCHNLQGRMGRVYDRTRRAFGSSTSALRRRWAGSLRSSSTTPQQRRTRSRAR